MAIPPMVAVAVPVAMPIPGLLSENVFLPVTAKTIVSIPEIVSIPQLASGVSLVPHACDGWISAIREWRETIALIGCPMVTAVYGPERVTAPDSNK